MSPGTGAVEEEDIQTEDKLWSGSSWRTLKPSFVVDLKAKRPLALASPGFIRVCDVDGKLPEVFDWKTVKPSAVRAWEAIDISLMVSSSKCQKSIVEKILRLASQPENHVPDVKSTGM